MSSVSFLRFRFNFNNVLFGTLIHFALLLGKIYIATDSSPVDMQSYELCCDMIDVVIDVSCIYGLTTGDDISPAFDHHSQATIRLNNGTVLHLREVNRFLALVCILREDAMEKQGKFMHYWVWYTEQEWHLLMGITFLQE